MMNAGIAAHLAWSCSTAVGPAELAKLIAQGVQS